MGSRTKTITATVLVIIMCSVLFVAWWLWARETSLPEGLTQANGRIEGDHYVVASKMPGRVAELFAHEGDAVDIGQVLLRLEDTQIRAKVERTRQALRARDAQLKTTISQEKQAHHDAKRFQSLFAQGTTTKRESEQMELAWTLAKNQVNAAKALRAEAKAAVTEAQSVLHDLTITAPSTGIITTRIVNAGEVVTAGAPLFDIVDLDRLYLKAYIQELHIGKIRLNLPAQVYIDAYPDQHFPATVRYISSRAEFTPKEVQTHDERVKLVYAVKLYLDKNPEHRLTPGLPADAIIRWDDDAQWVSPRW